MKRVLASLLIGWLLISPTEAASLFSDRYDVVIADSVKRWWPDRPQWRLLKAQLYQESLLEPDAVSPAGARGLGQFMPKTWEEVSRQLGYGMVSPHVAELSIEAAAYYMARLRKNWPEPRPVDDRHGLALASYNAGLGNLLKAQRACGSAKLYHEIMDCLPAVTGHHARETSTYVERVWRWHAALEVAR